MTAPLNFSETVELIGKFPKNPLVERFSLPLNFSLIFGTFVSPGPHLSDLGVAQIV